MFTRSFAQAALERAVKAFAGALLAFLPANATNAIPDLNWGDMLAFAGLTALASLLFSIVSAPFGGTGPSLANEVISPPAIDPGEDAAGYGAVELLVAVLVVVLLVLLILRVA